ncbi:FAS1 domain-containing protein [Heracleum sosnowskyi]|uniref:FAS1 domain-containing protein n=1 Tax=Heracleum sosnowskyi TaxID=360622 RepID=A0AAD8J0N1_9APIA|nr:FAS1 domain-containing protein [Heracleum sosnowskyi]
MARYCGIAGSPMDKLTKKRWSVEGVIKLTLHLPVEMLHLILVVCANALSSPPPPPFSSKASPSTALVLPELPSTALVLPELPTPPMPEFFQATQIMYIMQALFTSQGDFTIWCMLLTGHTTGPVLPLYATLFVPSNPSVIDLRHAKPAEIDPFLMPYHVVPQRLSFDDLLGLDLETRLPTLLPSKSIIITSNSSSNFTVGDTQITHPNTYLSPNIAVHGIKSTFNYRLYGEEIHVTRRRNRF